MCSSFLLACTLVSLSLSTHICGTMIHNAFIITIPLPLYPFSAPVLWNHLSCLHFIHLEQCFSLTATSLAISMAQKSFQVLSNAGSGSTISPVSLFSSVSESVKTIFKKDEKPLWPFKKSKIHLSAHSKLSTIDQDVTSQNAMNNDKALTVSSDLSNIEIIEVDPEKELGMFVKYSYWPLTNSWPCITEALKKCWCLPIYSFFKSNGVSIQYHNGHMCHFFPCAAWKCKTAIGEVHRFQDSKDKSLTTNLRHHTNWCFGEEAVENGKAEVIQSASIFTLFTHQGQQPVQYSYQTHTNTEVW